MMDDLPGTHMVHMYDAIFKKLVREALLKYFKEEMQANYYVSDWAQMSDGDWVIEFKRTLESWKREKARGEE